MYLFDKEPTQALKNLSPELTQELNWKAGTESIYLGTANPAFDQA